MEKLKGEATFLLRFTLPMPLVNSDQMPDAPMPALRAFSLPRNKHEQTFQ